MHLPIRAAALALLLALAGCGEQDLYRPPESLFHVSGRVALPTEAEDVDILDNYAYVAAGQGGLHVVDISDPDHPRLVRWANTKKFAESVVAAQTYDGDGTPRRIAFVVDGTEGITTFDITSPDTLLNFGTGTTAYDGKGLCYVPAATVTDPYMLFLADSWRGLTVFFQILNTPGALDFQRADELRIFTYGYTKNLVYVDGFLYIAEDQMGVTVVDARALPSGGLVLQENFDTPGYALDIDHAGGFLFVADGLQGLCVMEITPDHRLEIAARLALMGDCRAIEIHEGTAFLAAEDAGLQLVDVRDPRNPRWLGNVPTLQALGVAVGAGNVVCVADRDEGLIVFRGPELADDVTPPAAVSDLSPRLGSIRDVTLSWRAPGDDGAKGRAEIYDLRWGTAPLSEATWEQAVPVVRRPLPQAAGTLQQLEFTDLTPGATYYFALKTRDDAGNWSALSNVAAALMTAPELSAGGVTPDSGGVTTLFTYAVTYRDAEGDAPARMDAIIDGTAHAMLPVDATPDYAGGARYEYATTLGLGSHEYQFAGDDGHGPLVTTALTVGPKLPPDPFDFTLRTIAVSGGATFAMGSPTGERGRDSDETQHDVTLTRDYLIAETEVTQALYEAINGQNPAGFSGLLRPVESVTWYDAIKFCNALSAHEGLAPAYGIEAESYDDDGHLIAAIITWVSGANGYRLPTEAEWEYACRAGSATALCTGALSVERCESDPLLNALGWYCGNSDIGTGAKPQDVAAKEPNDFGLFDMHGNVWEWVWDTYAAYPTTPQTDPTGPPDDLGAQRVRRGGHWGYYARDCRSASRDAFWPGSADHTLGFRLARNAD